MQQFQAVTECHNEDHDHEETSMGRVIEMECSHCESKLHYNVETEDYHHNQRPLETPVVCWLHKVPADSICFTYDERLAAIFVIDGLCVALYGCHAYHLIDQRRDG